jgi:hypothetical protein
MPLLTQTIGQKEAKIKLEAEIDEVENAIRMF